MKAPSRHCGIMISIHSHKTPGSGVTYTAPMWTDASAERSMGSRPLSLTSSSKPEMGIGGKGCVSRGVRRLGSLVGLELECRPGLRRAAPTARIARFRIIVWVSLLNLSFGSCITNSKPLCGESVILLTVAIDQQLGFYDVQLISNRLPKGASAA